MRDMRNISNATVKRAHLQATKNQTVPGQKKIGTNFFQFQNKDYLVTVDYFSNFFELSNHDHFQYSCKEMEGSHEAVLTHLMK